MGGTKLYGANLSTFIGEGPNFAGIARAFCPIDVFVVHLVKIGQTAVSTSPLLAGVDLHAFDIFCMAPAIPLEVTMQIEEGCAAFTAAAVVHCSIATAGAVGHVELICVVAFMLCNVPGVVEFTAFAVFVIENAIVTGIAIQFCVDSEIVIRSVRGDVECNDFHAVVKVGMRSYILRPL